MSDMIHENQTPDTGADTHDTGFWKVLPFFLVMAVLTAASFLLFLRPTVSYAEKRELAKFPEFSLSALADGSYFADITTWFSDTFPGRETWLEIADYTASLHGYSDISFSSDFAASGDQVPEIPTQEATQPDPAGSTEPGGADQQTGSGDETQPSEETEPSEETQPAETEWGGVDAGEDAEIALGAVIQIDDTAFNQLSFSESQCGRYIDTLNGLAEKLEPMGARVITCIAPTSVGVMVEEEYLEMLNCSPQDQILNFIHSGMSDKVVTVNAFPNLVAHNSEYLYFRTDHHWTALGAYYAYEALCQTLGFDAVPLSEFEEVDKGEFRGSLYGKVQWPQKLRQDNVYAYVPQGDISVKAFFNNNASSVDKELIIDVSHRTVYETYLTFLGGDCALMEITNESIPDAPSCVVIKDSYGNCFVPYLTQHYYKVYAIDYREYYEMNLQTFVEYFGIQDVIFAPNLTAVQSITGQNLFYDLSFKYTGKRWQ